MKTIRTLTPEVRVIDAQRGLVDYVASDQTLDSYNEIIMAAGWKFTRFAANAPFVDSHDYYCIDKLLGRVVEFSVQGKQLVERVQWAVDVPENALAQLGWKMTVNGYLRAVSVGFVPVRYVSKWRNDPTEMAQVVTELGLDAATAAKVSCIYQEQEQLELSACIIGANPNALAKAHRDGAIGDGDLAACGFDDEGMEFLHAASGQISATESEYTRRAIAGLFAQFARTLSPKKQPNAEAAKKRAAAAEAHQRVREKTLAELQAITTNLRKS
jgi:hypothetical protein